MQKYLILNSYIVCIKKIILSELSGDLIQSKIFVSFKFIAWCFAACDCSTCGTSECDSHTGQCHCRDNVVGEKCDRCQAEHYGFNSCQVCENNV